MTTKDITHFETPEIDNTIVEYEHIEIRPFDNNLNSHGEIRLEINNENAYTRPSDSYLLIEGDYFKVDTDNGNVSIRHNKANAIGTHTLVKEGLLYLFSNIRYEINNKQVESIYNPGQVQNMLSYLLEDSSYNDTLSLGHCGVKDKSITVANNAGVNERNNLIWSSTPDGAFSFYIPLKRLFGFFRDYDKLIFGTNQRLVLTRKHDDDAIYRTAAGDLSRITLSKTSWFVPHVIANEKTMSSLLKFRTSNKDINLAFRGVSCTRYEVPQDTTFTYRLGAKPATERPRYLLLGFQTDKENNQERNPALFDFLNLTNLRVLLNDKQYPTVEYTANLARNDFMRLYTDAMKFKSKFFEIEQTESEITSSPGIGPLEFRTLFPIFVVDLSKQVERAEKSLTDILIQARFGTAVPQNTRLFAVLISDTIMTLKSDGTRVILTS